MTKALTFLDYVKSQPQFVSYSNGKADITDFYSQEFKPKMIVEYFEGWKLDSPSQIDYICDNYKCVFHIIDFSRTSERALVYNVIPKLRPFRSSYGFVVPKTLNDFISDADRTGIELNWKEEIVKMFK